MNRHGFYKLVNLIKSITPLGIRNIVRKNLPLTKWDQHFRIQNNPFANYPPEYSGDGSKYTIGIIYEYMQYHKANIAACREMGVSYKLIDIAKDNWIELVEKSGCDAFLVWPSINLSIWKEMFDDRLYFLENELGKIIYPALRETWLYENKRRVRDWLKINGFELPKTWIFYDSDGAFEFGRKCDLPIVVKTNIGASGSGVWIMRDRSQLSSMIKTAFSKGIAARNRSNYDREWGVIMLQEYLPNAKEWRMMRIGNSYYGYRKEKVGDFHSGSGAWSWLDPPRKLLKLLHDVTEAGGFTSMDVDIFETEDGRYLVNELQTVFGALTPKDMLHVDGVNGRYLYNKEKDEWIFDPGDHSRNMCANARLDYLINHILPNLER